MVALYWAQDKVVAPSGDTGLEGGARQSTFIGSGGNFTALGLAELVPGKWCREGKPSCLACYLGISQSGGTFWNPLTIYLEYTCAS